jgi:hypothetical protein
LNDKKGKSEKLIQYFVSLSAATQQREREKEREL